MGNISLEVVLGMLFLILNGTDVDFLGRELTKKTLSTIKRIKLIGKKEFAAAKLDPEHKTYVVHVRLVSSIALSSFSPGFYKGPC